MEGIGLKFVPEIVSHLLAPLSMLRLWLALLGLMVSANTPNGGFNLSFAKRL